MNGGLTNGINNVLGDMGEREMVCKTIKAGIVGVGKGRRRVTCRSVH